MSLSWAFVAAISAARPLWRLRSCGDGRLLLGDLLLERFCCAFASLSSSPRTTGAWRACRRGPSTSGSTRRRRPRRRRPRRPGARAHPAVGRGRARATRAADDHRGDVIVRARSPLATRWGPRVGRSARRSDRRPVGHTAGRRPAFRPRYPAQSSRPSSVATGRWSRMSVRPCAVARQRMSTAHSAPPMRNGPNGTYVRRRDPLHRPGARAGRPRRATAPTIDAAQRAAPHPPAARRRRAA